MFLVTYIVQFEVKAAGVTHRVPVPVAPPQGGGGGLAVCAAGACASSGRLKETEKYVVNNDELTCRRKVSADIKRQLKWRILKPELSSHRWAEYK